MGRVSLGDSGKVEVYCDTLWPFTLVSFVKFVYFTTEKMQHNPRDQSSELGVDAAAKAATEAKCFVCTRRIVANPSGIAQIEVYTACNNYMHAKCTKGRHEVCCEHPTRSTIRCTGAANTVLSALDIAVGVSMIAAQLSQTAVAMDDSRLSSSDSRMEFSFTGETSMAAEVTMATYAESLQAPPTFRDTRSVAKSTPTGGEKNFVAALSIHVYVYEITPAIQF